MARSTFPESRTRCLRSDEADAVAGARTHGSAPEAQTRAALARNWEEGPNPPFPQAGPGQPVQARGT